MECIRQEETTRKDLRAHDCLIFFIDRDNRAWWDWIGFTREGFRHCFMVQWCEWSKRWIAVDWRETTTDFIIFFDFEIEMLVKGIGRRKGTVIRFRRIEDPIRTGGLITYCSNIISRFLGLGNSLILTPYGLYRRLLKSGGEVVFDWRSHEHKAETNGATGRAGKNVDRAGEAAAD